MVDVKDELVCFEPDEAKIIRGFRVILAYFDVFLHGLR
jgi:hypothetical protein